MRTFTTNLILSFAISAGLLVANTASAGGFGFGGGGGNGNGGGNGGGHDNGGFKISFGGGHHDNHNNHHNNHHNFHHGHYYHHGYYHRPYVKPYYVAPVQIYSKCYYPEFSSCSVYAGDTFSTLSGRAYGVSTLGRQIATYNGLSMNNAFLAPGQQLQFPVVNPDGTLTPSSAPAHVSYTAPGQPLGFNNTVVGRSTSTTAPVAQADDRSLPSVAIGSTLLLDGQSLGSDKGIVRLRFGGVALPVEVIEWSASAAKIQLPKIDLDTQITAELEVVRADGSLASKSAIKLTPAATRLALGK